MGLWTHLESCLEASTLNLCYLTKSYFHLDWLLYLNHHTKIFHTLCSKEGFSSKKVDHVHLRIFVFYGLEIVLLFFANCFCPYAHNDSLIQNFCLYDVFFVFHERFISFLDAQTYFSKVQYHCWLAWATFLHEHIYTIQWVYCINLFGRHNKFWF
jgi:hypothetical protein